MNAHSYQVGQTLPGDHSRARDLELERLVARRSRKIRLTIIVVIISLVAIALLTWLTIGIVNIINDRRTNADLITASNNQPTVPIIDESTGGHISDRVNTFIARLETDFRDLGLAIDHVVLPLQKAREVDIYLTNRREYYKMSIDRGSAAQAEDTTRMIRYLTTHKKSPTYVDLRTPGKAYYK